MRERCPSATQPWITGLVMSARGKPMAIGCGGLAISSRREGRRMEGPGCSHRPFEQISQRCHNRAKEDNLLYDENVGDGGSMIAGKIALGSISPPRGPTPA